MTPPLQLVLTESIGIPRAREPVTVGVPFPRGALPDCLALTLGRDDGTPVPLQAAPLSAWPDGSVKWALLDFQADVPAHSTRVYEVRHDRRPGPGGAARPLPVRDVTAGLEIDTGAARFTIDRHRGVLHAEQGTARWRLVDGRNATHEPRVSRLWVETAGPLRSTVGLEGHFRPRSGVGRPVCQLLVRLSFFASSPVVRLAVTVRNPRRARHRKNCWDLGDPGSLYFRDLSLTLGLPGEEPARGLWSPEPGTPAVESERPDLEIYQDSSGGENWQSPNHVNRENRVTTAFRGYRLRHGDRESAGLRAQPLVGVFADGHGVAASLRDFWQQFPKAVEILGPTLTVRLFPHQSADVHELQGGEQKTHTLDLAFLRSPASLEPLAWTRAPLVALAVPEWYAASGAVPYLTPRRTDQDPDYLALVDAALDGDDTFERKREMADEYGWRHFGDLPADHEAVYYEGSGPLVSHYNNQYDAIYGAFVSLLRSGDLRWLTMLDRLARHVIDIDLYHTTEDRAAYNHGLFWHTEHYTTAATATHRCFSRRNRSPGGGPGSEHCYTTGLLHHYYLTGDPDSRQAVLDCARWIIEMDDGRRHVLRRLDSGDTGYASATGGLSYHGPGRGAGNAVQALLNGYALSRDPRFLDKAEALIRRCVHPLDDVPARNLLDVERRWSYTVFLQTLGRYLDLKIEWGQIDPRYAHAQASLLHYARWMAAHERPYLSRPEELEYPTETWAAQDMRKSDVLAFAARHARGAERDGFRQRSEFFFRASLEALSAAKTRTLTRPVVIMMSCGYGRAYTLAHPDDTAPPAPPGLDLGTPERFVPQRERVRQKLGLLGTLPTGPLSRWLRAGAGPPGTRGQAPAP